MVMPPRLRKAALTLHVITSIGWFGAVLAFLALAIVGQIHQNPQLAQAAYLVMGVTVWYAIVPLALSALFSGIISSLFTRWGLFRYYWVLMKLVITILATLVLFIHTQAVDLLSGAAVKMAPVDVRFQTTQLEMVVASGLALVVLLVLAVLSIYKPRGVTGYGLRKLLEQRKDDQQQKEILEEADNSLQRTDVY